MIIGRNIKGHSIGCNASTAAHNAFITIGADSAVTTVPIHKAVSAPAFAGVRHTLYATFRIGLNTTARVVDYYFLFMLHSSVLKTKYNIRICYLLQSNQILLNSRKPFTIS